MWLTYYSPEEGFSKTSFEDSNKGLKSSNEIGMTFTAKRYDIINLSFEQPLSETISSTEWSYFDVKLNTVIPKLKPTALTDISPRTHNETDYLVYGATEATDIKQRVDDALFRLTGQNFNSDTLYMEYYDGTDWKELTISDPVSPYAGSGDKIGNVFSDELGNYIKVPITDNTLWQFRIKSKAEDDVPVTLNLTADYRPYYFDGGEWVNKWHADAYLNPDPLFANSTTLSKSFTALATVINTPSVEIVTHPTCDDEDKGEVKVTARGPVKESYTWELWLNGDTVKVGTSDQPAWNIDELVAGYYKIVITKVNGEQIAPEEQKFLLTVADVDALGVSVDATATVQPTCDSPASGKLTFIGTGGTETAVYKYELWHNGTILDADTISKIDDLPAVFTGLSAGNYKVVLTDTTCQALLAAEVEVELTVADVTALEGEIRIDAYPSCLVPDGGAISVINVDGGTDAPDYEYQLWLNGAKTTNSNGVFGDLTAGNYTVKILDKSCPSLAPAQYEVLLQDTATVPLRVWVSSKTEPTCANDDGSITISVTGGSETPDYRFEWSKSGKIIVPQPTSTKLEDLPAGEYTVTVYDANCEAIIPVVLNITLEKDFNLLEIKIDEKIDPACPGEESGSIRVSVIGGNGDYFYKWKNSNGDIISNEEDLVGVGAGIYSLTVTAKGTTCSVTVDNIELKDPFAWNKETIKDYINLLGQDLRYQNGYNVPAIRLLTNDLPEGSYISWEAIPVNNDSIGIAKGGDGEIPGFEAYNPKVAGESQVIIRVTIWNSSCEENKYSGSFTITVTPKTIDDKDLLADAVRSQVKCAEEPFDDIIFTAHRTDGALLGEVSYIVEFAGGTDVLNGAKLEEIPTTANGLWDISTITDRRAGEGTYRVIPRSNNSEGLSVLFTLTVMPAPQVDPVPNTVVCNESPLSVIFTGKDPNTIFDWTADTNAQILGIPESGTSSINVPILRNSTNGILTGTITVAPRLSGCPGVSDSVRTFTVSVLPTPEINSIANLIVENGEAVPAIPFSGTATKFRWVNNNPAIDEFNSLTSGEGMELPGFSSENDSDSPIMAKITVTPIYEDYEVGYSCEGKPYEFYILVASKPAIHAISDLTACENEVVSPINPNGLPSGNGYFITWTGGADIGLADNDGTICNRYIYSFTAQSNNPNVPTTATIIVTPHVKVNGQDFKGDDITFKYTIIPNTKPETGYEESTITGHEYCSGEEIRIDVKGTGYGLTYQWYKDHSLIPGATGAELVIDATTVDHTVSGKYYAVVTGVCGSFISKTYNIKMKLNVVNQRWNDVLTVDCYPEENGGFIFTEFQWYTLENGVSTKLEDEIKSYLYIPEGIRKDIEYYVVMKTKSGVDYTSCPVSGQEAIFDDEVSVYPNPVHAGRTINIEINIPEGDLASAKIFLVDFKGAILKTASASRINQMIMPNTQGVYIIHVTAGDRYTKKFKVIVE
ncbi:MAG: T9SS type A sorting domain-containing protein [Dysgonamonadaceae bacterium]|jgi:hypothetical protein|nr:T9SS type A sorting domain-containing protein [Dysgonamonadaceae bacterium]